MSSAQVVYVMKYNPAGEIVNVTVSLVLGFVRGATLPLKQEFHITFVQVVSLNNTLLTCHGITVHLDPHAVLL